MKIICSDYDGTLNHGGITEKKLDAIRKWQEGGNLFAVVSGRGKDFFGEMQEKGIPIDFLLSCNGGVIADRSNNIISEARCSDNIGKELVDFIFSLGCPFAIICGKECFRIKNPDFPEENGVTEYDEALLRDFNQISTGSSDFQETARVTALIKERFGTVINPLQNGTCIDIVPLGTDKAQGIYELMKYTGAEFGDIIAVGDNVNDEAMIKEFYSYAMANGVGYIKELADEITVSIEELIEKELLK